MKEQEVVIVRLSHSSVPYSLVQTSAEKQQHFFWGIYISVDYIAVLCIPLLAVFIYWIWLFASFVWPIWLYTLKCAFYFTLLFKSVFSVVRVHLHCRQQLEALITHTPPLSILVCIQFLNKNMFPLVCVMWIRERSSRWFLLETNVARGSLQVWGCVN